MRSSKQTITRRAFLATPAVLAAAGTAAPSAAMAFAPSIFDGIEKGEVGRTAMLSARNCAREGFAGLPWWLPRPFEADLLLKEPTLIRDLAFRAGDIIARGSFDAGNFTDIMLVTLPKYKHDARRICAIAEPLDTVVYLTLGVLAAPAIEVNRIPVSSNVVHSYRFMPGRDRVFDQRFNILSFLGTTAERAKDGGFIVKCDLASCFGSMGSERVAAALEHCGVPGWQVEYIARLLRFWRHPDSPGLPVGPIASRIFAEAVLLHIDHRLHEAGVQYLRYVDDFRLFAPDETAARHALVALREAAASEGFILNADKTQILNLAKMPGDADPSAMGGKPELTPDQDYSLMSAYFRDTVQPPGKRKKPKVGSVGTLPDFAAALEQGAFLPPSAQYRRDVAQAIYVGDNEFLRTIPQMLRAYPEYAAFTASALTQASSFLAGSVRDRLRSELAAMLLDRTTPEFLATKLIEILAHPDYRDREALVRFALASVGNPRGIAFRAALDGMRENGGVAPELTDHFAAMDGWGRRALLADPVARQSVTYPTAELDVIASRLAG